MSKSRAERGNKTPSSNQNPPPVSNTIVAGRFTECDWNELLENESHEEFVWDIVNDVANNACNIIFEKIITDRVAPYAVFSAKQTLLDLIEWQFLESDAGEHVDIEPAWDEDDEPAACITDSWAQGAVPVVSSLRLIGTPNTDITTMSPSLIDNMEINEQSEINDEENTTEGIHGNEKTAEQEEDQDSKESLKCVKECQSTSPKEPEKPLSPLPPKIPNQKVHKKDNKQISKKISKKHKGSLPKFTPISLTPVTDDHPTHSQESESRIYQQHGAPLHSADSLFKNQHGRPPGVKEVVYDEAGNVTHVQKINVGSIPDYRVKTKIVVVDSSRNENHSNRKSRSIKSKNNNNNISPCKSTQKINPGPIIQHLKDGGFNSQRAQHQPNDLLKGVRSGGGLRTPLPPSLVDTINVSEGVTIKEGAILKRGPKKQTVVYVDEQTLKPVQNGRGLTLDVHDIINKTKPTLNSYSRSKPLPAILM